MISSAQFPNATDEDSPHRISCPERERISTQPDVPHAQKSVPKIRDFYLTTFDVDEGTDSSEVPTSRRQLALEIERKITRDVPKIEQVHPTAEVPRRHAVWLYYFRDEEEVEFVLATGTKNVYFFVGGLVTVITATVVGVGILPYKSNAWYVVVVLLIIFVVALVRELALMFCTNLSATDSAVTVVNDEQQQQNNNLLSEIRIREGCALLGMVLLGVMSVLFSVVPSFAKDLDLFYTVQGVVDLKVLDRTKCCAIDGMFLVVLMLPLAVRMPRFFLASMVYIFLVGFSILMLLMYGRDHVFPSTCRIFVAIAIGSGMMWNVRAVEVIDRLLFELLHVTKRVAIQTNEERVQLERFVHSLLPPPLRKRIFAPNYSVAVQCDGSTVTLVHQHDIAEYCHKLLPSIAARNIGSIHACVELFAHRHHLLGVSYSGDSCLVIGNANNRNTPQRILRFVMDLQAVAKDQDYVLRVAVHCGPLVGCVVGQSLRRYTVIGEALTVAGKMLSNVSAASTFQLLISSQFRCTLESCVTLQLHKVDAGLALEHNVEVFEAQITHVPCETAQEAIDDDGGNDHLYGALGLSSIDDSQKGGSSAKQLPILCGVVHEFEAQQLEIDFEDEKRVLLRSSVISCYMLQVVVSAVILSLTVMDLNIYSGKGFSEASRQQYWSVAVLCAVAIGSLALAAAEWKMLIAKYIHPHYWLSLLLEIVSALLLLGVLLGALLSSPSIMGLRAVYAFNSCLAAATNWPLRPRVVLFAVYPSIVLLFVVGSLFLTVFLNKVLLLLYVTVGLCSMYSYVHNQNNLRAWFVAQRRQEEVLSVLQKQVRVRNGVLEALIPTELRVAFDSIRPTLRLIGLGNLPLLTVPVPDIVLLQIRLDLDNFSGQHLSPNQCAEPIQMLVSTLEVVLSDTHDGTTTMAMLKVFGDILTVGGPLQGSRDREAYVFRAVTILFELRKRLAIQQATTTAENPLVVAQDFSDILTAPVGSHSKMSSASSPRSRCGPVKFSAVAVCDFEVLVLVNALYPMIDLLGGGAAYTSHKLLNAVTPGVCVANSSFASIYEKSNRAPLANVSIGAAENWKVRGLGLRSMHLLSFKN